MFRLLLLFCLYNNSFASKNPFLPPQESIVVKDITDLDSAKIGDQIERPATKEKHIIKTIQSKMPSLEAKIENWYVLSATIKNRNVCYLVKYPDEQITNHKESRKPYLIISFISNKRYELSISAGYKYRGSSSVKISIDGILSKLTGNNNLAWTKGTIEDMTIIKNMMNSFRMMVESESSVGTYAIDIYDLLGFNEAYNKMISVCKNKY